MNYFQSKTTLMLAMALLLVGVSLIFGSAFGPAGETETPVMAAGSDSVSGSDGYTDRMIATKQEQVKADPGDTKSLAALGTAYLQKARETNDPTFYAQAESAFQKALALDANYYDALAGMGALELARHAFEKAQEWGLKARQSSPRKAYAYGVIGDARVELGDYEGAIESFQQMVDLRPDLGSYSRVSYARELYGDVDGAVEAMQQAIQAGGPAAENTAWCRVQLGHLYFNSNRLPEAEKAYNDALLSYPNYLHAVAGLGQVRWGQARPEEAIELYKQSVASIPLPQYLTALGDLYAQQGDADAAQEQYDLVTYIFTVFEKSGVDVAVEKAAFLADYNLETAQAVMLIEEAAKSRNDIHTQDALAWTLYRAGRYEEALSAQEKAMRLGTKNSLFYYHLGVIQSALGDTTSARASLQQALDINPNFSIRHSAEAKQMLNEHTR